MLTGDLAVTESWEFCQQVSKNLAQVVVLDHELLMFVLVTADDTAVQLLFNAAPANTRSFTSLISTLTSSISLWSYDLMALYKSVYYYYYYLGGSVAEWLACWTQVQ